VIFVLYRAAEGSSAIRVGLARRTVSGETLTRHPGFGQFICSPRSAQGATQRARAFGGLKCLSVIVEGVLRIV
jgi:hypothetical protein